MMSPEDAYWIVARRVVANAASGANQIEPEWENYPEIGEHDWVLVLGRVNDVCRQFNPKDQSYSDAYALLTERAEGVEA
jgi:hypothetical protein